MLVRLFMHFEGLKTLFCGWRLYTDTDTLIEWALSVLGWNIQVVKRREQHIFKVKPQALDCAENQRTFAWLS